MHEPYSAQELDLSHVRGIPVLFQQNESLLTSIQILTNVGSCVEEPDTHGMAHILEHMFFKGSRRRPGAKAISRAANDIGGKMNAYTAYDHTVYYISVLNDSFEQGFDILADMVTNPLFPEDEFRREINPILSELREREDEGESFLTERALHRYLGGQYHPIIGTVETIRGATVEKMHAFHKRYYGRNNFLISIVGGISKARALKAVEDLFIAQPDVETARPPLVPTTPGEIVLRKPGITEAVYLLYFPALPIGHPDRYKQDLMNYILGGNDSSLLFERIREELGLSCYGIDSFTMRYRPFSILTVACGIAPEELETLHKEVVDQIDRIASSRVEEEKLKRAKASLMTSIAAQAETSGGLNSMIGVPVLRGETEHPVTKAMREFNAVTLDDVLDQAQKTFAEPAFKAVLLPE